MSSVERPVAQVQRIEMVRQDGLDEVPADPMWRLEIGGICADFATETWANNFRNAVIALTSERPSEAAVAWRWRTLPQFSEDAADQEWQLVADTPDFINPHHHEVQPLYAIPHGDAVWAQTIEECAKIAELDFALRFTNFDKRDAVRKALADVAKAIRALQPSKE